MAVDIQWVNFGLVSGGGGAPSALKRDPSGADFTIEPGTYAAPFLDSLNPGGLAAMDVVVPPGGAIKIQMYSPGSAQVVAPTTLGGGTYSGSQLTMTASGTPTWDIPPGRALRCYCVSTTGGTFHLSPLRLASVPVGTPYWWGPATLGGTASLPSPDPADPRGAWVLPATSGLTLIGTKAWSGAKTFTVPFYRTGAGTINAKITATTGTATLVTADGATVNGDGSLTIPADTHLFPSWTATDGATLTLTKGAGTGYAFYGPLYLDETVVPPTPPPTITKIIPASGSDTGGTLVDIIGTDLTGATAVDFGGTAGTGLTVDPSGGLATVTSPAHTAGPAPVTITTPAGVSNAETFTFEAPPVVTVPVIYAAYPLYLCADGADRQQVLIPIIYPITDVVSAEVDGVHVGVGGVLDIDEVGFVVMGAPVLPVGTYDLVLTNSAGSSDPYPIEYVDCEGCPPDPTVVAVFPGAARPGATIQIVGTNLADATVTMCGETVAIVSNDGNIITVVVPPGCPDGPTTITVTTPDGETTVEFTVLPPEPVPPADVSPRSWQIAQALLDAAFLCGAECARAFVTTDATPEGPPPGGCPCQLTATIVKDGYKTADGRRLVRSATIKLSLHQCTPIPQADEIPDPDTESDYALRQAETRDQMLRGLATARRQPSSVLGRCQTKQASEGWVHVSTTGGMSLYTMEVTVD